MGDAALNCCMTAIPEGRKALWSARSSHTKQRFVPTARCSRTPVWYGWDGEVLRFSISAKHQKNRNVVANPVVALSIRDPANALRYLDVRGVIDIVELDRGGGEYRASIHRRTRNGASIVVVGEAEPPLRCGYTEVAAAICSFNGFAYSRTTSISS